MSLSAVGGGGGGMPNALTTGMAYNPNMGGANPGMSGPSMVSPAPVRMPGTVGPVSEDNSRGDFSGDLCSCIDLFAPLGLQSATWSEEKSECHYFTNERYNTTIALTEQGKSLIESNTNLTLEQLTDSKDDIIVTKSGTRKSKVDASEVIPLRLLQDSSNDSVMEGAITALLLYGMQGPWGSDQKMNNKMRRSKKLKKKVTMISPCSYDQLQTASFIRAAHRGGLSVQNIFNRGVAVATGMLYRGSALDKSSDSGDKKSKPGLLQWLEKDTDDPVVVYLNVYCCGKMLYFDTALVRFEGGNEAGKIGCSLGFERLNTLAALGGSISSDGNEVSGDISLLVKEKIGAAINQLKTIAPVGVISAVVLDGMLLSSTHKRLSQVFPDVASMAELSLPEDELKAMISKAGIDTTGVSVFKAHERDAVIGGSLLSAAELDSSKNYLNLEEGWKIAHLLPIADGTLLSGDVAIEVQWSSSQKLQLLNSTRDDFETNSCAEVLYKINARAWKEEIGPIRPKYGMKPGALVVRKNFHWGSKNTPDNKVPQVGWPKLHILQRNRGISNEYGKWRLIKTLTPLVANNSNKNKKLEPVKDCTVHITIDPSTSVVATSEVKGETVSESWENFWFRAQLIFVLLLPFLLIGGYYLYSYASEWYTHRQHIEWLTNFYRHNAPDKLSDPGYVERTIRKYKGRMFLLWRNLEKTYDLKWSPPKSIVDTFD